MLPGRHVQRCFGCYIFSSLVACCWFTGRASLALKIQSRPLELDSLDQDLIRRYRLDAILLNRLPKEWTNWHHGRGRPRSERHLQDHSRHHSTGAFFLDRFSDLGVSCTQGQCTVNVAECRGLCCVSNVSAQWATTGNVYLLTWSTSTRSMMLAIGSGGQAILRGLTWEKVKVENDKKLKLDKALSLNNVILYFYCFTDGHSVILEPQKYWHNL